MATAGGKTIVFSSLIKYYLERYPKMKTAILAHRQELVLQAADKLKKVWPLSYGQIGIACKSLQKVVINAPIIIGTVQTLARRDILNDIHLLIVDEVHHIPRFRNIKPSQYQTFIEQLRGNYPNLRILGVTATPYRLNQGYIYGHDGDLFDQLDYRIGMEDLINDGWLVPLRAKGVETLGEELSNVRIGQNGDYRLDDLSMVMEKPVHIESAVQAYRDYGEDRRSVLIFAITIEHAELLTNAFLRAGYRASLVHSKLDKLKRQQTLASFDKGELDFLVNVGVLTEGWDCPRVDLIIMTRPTLSPGLYVQMIGRGTRLFPDKKDLLVLDLVGNFQMHGQPWAPIVKEKKGPAIPPNTKICPRCQEIVDIDAEYCPECDYEFPVKTGGGGKELIDAGTVVLHDLLLGAVNDLEAKVLSWFLEGYNSRQGNYMARLALYTNIVPKKTLYHYLDFEGRASDFGKKKALAFWKKFSKNSTPPTSVEEACVRQHELNIPMTITIIKDKDFLKVKGW
jgi:DNA repair protein RadD